MENLGQLDDRSLDKILDKIIKRIKRCNHVFLRLNSEEDENSEIKFKCIKDCGCGNVNSGDIDLNIIAFSLLVIEEKEVFDAIFEKEYPNEEYYKRLEEFINSRLGDKSPNEEARCALMEEFDLILYARAFNRFYFKVLKMEGKVIDNPRLTEEEAVNMYNKISREGLLSVEDIVKLINAATPPRLIRHKEEIKL